MSRKNNCVIKCDACGKEHRKRPANMSEGELAALNDNYGCYCSKCSLANKKNQPAVVILAGDMYTVYPKVVDLEHLQGIKRARYILERSKRQLRLDQE